MVGKQSKQCKQNLDLMGTVSHAAYVAMDTCQGQFADRRWNCSSIRRTPKLSRDLTRGNRYCLAWDFELVNIGQFLILRNVPLSGNLTTCGLNLF